MLAATFDPITRLEEDHARFHRYMRGFLRFMETPEDADPRRLMLFREIALYFSQYPDELHHREEDLVYERLIAQSRADREATHDLWREHETLSVKARDFAETVAAHLSGGDHAQNLLAEAGRIYFGALSRHMAKEEEFLLTPARRTFGAKDFEALEEAIVALYAERINFDKARQIKALERSLDERLCAF